MVPFYIVLENLDYDSNHIVAVEPTLELADIHYKKSLSGAMSSVTMLKVGSWGAFSSFDQSNVVKAARTNSQSQRDKRWAKQTQEQSQKRERKNGAKQRKQVRRKQAQEEQK